MVLAARAVDDLGKGKEWTFSTSPVCNPARICRPNRWLQRRVQAAGDYQVDCQPLELAMFSLDGGGWVQAADLVIWTAMDRPGRPGKS
jgi:hypothetical protein